MHLPRARALFGTRLKPGTTPWLQGCWLHTHAGATPHTHQSVSNTQDNQPRRLPNRRHVTSPASHRPHHIYQESNPTHLSRVKPYTARH